MSLTDLTGAESGASLVVDFNELKLAFQTGNYGGSRPAYLAAGGTWVQVVSGSILRLNLFDGTNDIGIADFNTTTHTVTLTSSDIVTTTVNGSVPVLAPPGNRLINGMFRINQRVASSVAALNYGFDRWYVMTESGNVTLSQLTAPESGAVNAIRITQPDATAKRIGIAQPIEYLNCLDLRSQVVRLLGRVRASTSTPIRYAILSWTGTADAPTRNFVNSWSSSTFTSGNFFVSSGSGMNVLSCGSVTPGANVIGSLPFYTGAMASNHNNVIVAIWTENTMAQNATLDIWNVDLALGFNSVPSPRRAVSEELALCQRYYEKSYNLAVAPGTASFRGSIAWSAAATQLAAVSLAYRVQKFSNATPIIYSPNTGTSNVIHNATAVTDISFTLNSSATGQRSAVISNSSQGSAATFYAHYETEAEIGV